MCCWVSDGGCSCCWFHVLSPQELQKGQVSPAFTFMHLADAFIQSDLQCIQVTVFYILSALAFPALPADSIVRGKHLYLKN